MSLVVCHCKSVVLRVGRRPPLEYGRGQGTMWTMWIGSLALRPRTMQSSRFLAGTSSGPVAFAPERLHIKPALQNSFQRGGEVSVAPGLTFRAIAVLSGAVVLPFALPDSAADAAPRDVGHSVLSAPADPGPSGHPATAPTVPNLAVGSAPSNNFLPQGIAYPDLGLRPDGGRDDHDKKDVSASELPDVNCLARTICAIKDKIRWGTPAWTQTGMQDHRGCGPERVKAVFDQSHALAGGDDQRKRSEREGRRGSRCARTRSTPRTAA